MMPVQSDQENRPSDKSQRLHEVAFKLPAKDRKGWSPAGYKPVHPRETQAMDRDQKTLTIYPQNLYTDEELTPLFQVPEDKDKQPTNIISVDLNEVPEGLRDRVKSIVEILEDDIRSERSERMDEFLAKYQTPDIPDERWSGKRSGRNEKGELPHEFALRVWGDGETLDDWVTKPLVREYDRALVDAITKQLKHSAPEIRPPDDFILPSKTARRREKYLRTGGEGLSYREREAERKAAYMRQVRQK